MTEEVLYERYKGALRNGHVAAVRGHHMAALTAYAEAATLAPDRALPHSSMGHALLRLDRVDEALAAFGRALRLAPRDEAGLAGRAEALISAGRPAEAAGVLDLLADTQETAGRLPDACDTARRALELAESRARRRHLEVIVAELTGWPTERGIADHLARAHVALEAVAARQAAAADAIAAEQARAVDPTEPAKLALPVEPQSADDSVSEPVAEPLPDPGALSLAVDAAVATGDAGIVHAAVLDAVAKLRRGGLLDAAVDACQLGLTVAPADPDLHLALAELDLDHGWDAAAADKLVLLDRYVILTGDDPARKRLHELAAERLPDDPRLSALRS
ncbi:MAG: tetratricopeptide repeat protein [Chloroflexota bacterium]